MKWSIKLKEAANEGWFVRRVWWVKKSEAEKIIKALKEENLKLKSK